jgi:hypothetical protein
MSIFFTKNGEQEGRIGPVWGIVPVGWEDTRKGCRTVNIVEILYTHVLKWKNETC